MQQLNPSRTTGVNAPVMRAMRRLGALAVLAGGAVHLQQYLGADYHIIPTIGPLAGINMRRAASDRTVNPNQKVWRSRAWPERPSAG